MRFTAEHEWLEQTGATVTIGITDYAQGALGDIVYVELPAVGRTVASGEGVAVVESVKAASDVYAPIAGTITEVNIALTGQPALVNTSPEKDGWFFRLAPANPDDFGKTMDGAEYLTHIQALG